MRRSSTSGGTARTTQLFELFLEMQSSLPSTGRDRSTARSADAGERPTLENSALTALAAVADQFGGRANKMGVELAKALADLGEVRGEGSRAKGC